MKTKAFIVGNCQALPITTILNMSQNFSRLFETRRFPPVHVAKPEDVTVLHADLPRGGVLITQKITEEYRNTFGIGTETLRAKVASGSDTIVWPSLYFSLYNPELFYLKDEKNNSVNDTFDYHIRPVFKAYVDGQDAEAAVSQYRDWSFNAKSALEKILNDLRTREVTMDIKSADFISDNYQAQRLFHTFNHPTGVLLLNVAGQILERLGLKNDLPAALDYDPLNPTTYPILNSVRDSLGLTFAEKEVVRIRGAEQSALEAVRGYFAFYDRNPNLVPLNAEKLFGKK